MYDYPPHELPLLAVAPDARERLVHALGRKPDIHADLTLTSKRASGGTLTGPAPLLTSPTLAWPLASIAVLVLGLVGLIIAFSHNYGFIDGSKALQPLLFVAVYIGASALVVFAFVEIGRTVQETRGGITRGHYLFGAEIVDIEGQTLTITSLGLATAIELEEQRLDGSYLYTELIIRFEYRDELRYEIRDRVHAEAIQRRCVSTVERVQRALNEDDRERLTALLVFPPHLPIVRKQRQTMGQGPFRSLEIVTDAPVPDAVARVSTKQVITLGLIAVTMGSTLWYLRNQWSDRRSFEAAHRTGRASDYRLYLKGDGAFANRVRHELLPRAEFDLLARTGDIRSLQQFLFDHPQSNHVDDVTRLLAERHTRARSAVMTRTHENPGLQRYALRLIEMVQIADASVTVRYQRSGDDAMNELNRVLGERAHTGLIRTPAKSLILDSEIYERRISDILFSSLQTCLGNEFLHTSFATSRSTDGMISIDTDPITTGARDPTIDVDYTIVPSRKVYRADGFEHALTNSQVFIGLEIRFNIHFRTDDPEHDYRVELSVEPPNEFSWSPLRVFTPGTDAYADANLYKRMLERAFNRLSRQLRNRLACSPESENP